MSFRKITLRRGPAVYVEFEYTVGRYSTHIKKIGDFSNAVIGNCVDVSMDKYEVTPADVRRAILSSPQCPPAVLEFERAFDEQRSAAAAAKKDPGPRTRGFKQLVGKRIVDFRMSDRGEIILEDEEAGRYRIEVSYSRGFDAVVPSLFMLEGDEQE